MEPEWRVEGEGHSLAESFSFLTVAMCQGTAFGEAFHPSESIMGLFKGACESKSPYYVYGIFTESPLGAAFIQPEEVSRLLSRNHLFRIRHIDEACHSRCR